MNDEDKGKDEDKVEIPTGMGPNDPQDPEPEDPEELEEGEEEEFLSDCPLCGADAVLPRPNDAGEDTDAFFCLRCGEEWEDQASYRASLKAAFIRAGEIDFGKLKGYALKNALGVLSCLSALWETEPAKKLRDIYDGLPRQK